MTEFAGQIEYAKGLEGIIAAESKIGYVNGVEGKLNYRGYQIEDLANNSTFEETSYLLLYGKLPTRKQLESFNEKIANNRRIPDEIIRVLKNIPRDAHPMGVLRTAVSMLGNYDLNAEKEFSIEHYMAAGIRIISAMPTIVAAFARIRNGKEPIDPNPELSQAENFLYMYFGEKQPPDVNRLMDIALILHADHGMNASTFTGMVVLSSQADVYSTTVAAIGSLKGPLHGGANERALKMLNEIPSINEIDKFIEDYRAQGKKYMGWGHRVYKAYDPRATILKGIAKEVTKGEIYLMAEKLEELLLAKLGGKGIFPNVDYYSGAVYAALGLDGPDFTPIFAISRISGWLARQIEYIPENRIFRPRAVYVGPMSLEYQSIDDRNQ